MIHIQNFQWKKGNSKIIQKDLFDIKCCSKYASKFGKVSSGHGTAKAQLTFQSQGKAVLKNGSVQFSSVAQLCPTLCDPMDCSMPGFPVHHHLLEFAQTHVH